MSEEKHVVTKLFTPKNFHWSNDRDANLRFLDVVKTHMEDVLIMEGYLLLNRVYTALGFPNTSSGAVTGWTTLENEFNKPKITYGQVGKIDGLDRAKWFWITIETDGIIFDKIDAVNDSINVDPDHLNWPKWVKTKEDAAWYLLRAASDDAYNQYNLRVLGEVNKGERNLELWLLIGSEAPLVIDLLWEIDLLLNCPIIVLESHIYPYIRRAAKERDKKKSYGEN